MMRIFGRLLGLVLMAFVLAVALIWLFGSKEPVDLEAGFDARKFGEGVQVYFESVESAFDDIIPGTEKRVVWAEGGYERRTPYSVVYLHGFSATSEEIRPVPDRVAEALGANLVFTRLTGHGRTGEALAQATAADWMADTAEALAAARAVGEKVVVIGTSTGGTLAAAAALDPDLSRDIAAIIFVSPNFGLNSAFDGLLTWPSIRYWGPPVIGEWRDFEPRNEGHAKYWTTSYPSVATLPMAALVEGVVDLDFSKADEPALFWFSEEDQVVDPRHTKDVAERWGGPVTVHVVELEPQDDVFRHVIAGDIVSPGQTDAAVAGMLDWLASLGIE